MNESVRRFALLASLLLLAAAARADRGEPATDEAAEEAIERFEKAAKDEDPEGRRAAAEALGALRHEEVADRLLGALRRERDPLVRAAILEGLGRQRESAKEVGPKVERLLMKEAEEVAERRRKGDPGFPLDPRTGEPDPDDPETKAALLALEKRDRARAAALRCLLDLGYRKRAGAEAVEPLLPSACDPLVVAALDAIAAWELWEALPEVLALHRMYPRKDRWETGAVVHAGGTNATAKKEWMTVFGHPGKRTARPEVVTAIRSAVEKLTGREVDSPAELEALLREPEVKRKVRGRRR